MQANRNFRWLEGGLIGLVLLVALGLRLADLGARPMHADEANQAVKLGEMLGGGTYRFDPHDHHGPTLYYFGWLAANVRGETSLATLTETTVRLVPAIAGVLAVFALWWLMQSARFWPALLAALLLAVVPAGVYYSRYFIQESLLLAFSLGALACGREWWQRHGWGWAVGTGLFLGLMLATKASALVYATAAGLALASCGRSRPGSWRDVALAAGTALLVAGAFYASFGRNPAGLRDAVLTPLSMWQRVAGGESGHEKPVWYYAGLFLFQRTGGMTWDQSVLIVPALVGAWLGWRRGGLLRFMTVYTGVIFAVLSLTPYKTPWQVLNLLPGLCVLAAFALTRLRRWPAGLLAAVVVGGLLWQTRLAVFQRPVDERNPLAYAHTAPDMLKVPALAAAAPAGTVKVIGREYWPLPWYLRQRPQTGYWTEPPADCDGVLVYVAADQAEAVRMRLKGSYRESFLGLRPGVLIVVFSRVGE